jgi:hypothetical protein
MAVYAELGLLKGGRLRADLFAISMKGHIVIVEVKSSVADFTNDKKWESYLGYCSQFYFAMLEPVWAQVKSQIPKGVGVFIMNEDFTIRSVKSASKATLDDDTIRSLAIRAAFRSQDNPRRKNKKF